MTTNRDDIQRGARERAPKHGNPRGELERRREAMHAAEGHAGSIPRGNQQPEREIMGSHRNEWDRVLGH
jgi:hypothetical protein